MLRRRSVRIATIAARRGDATTNAAAATAGGAAASAADAGHTLPKDEGMGRRRLEAPPPPPPASVFSVIRAELDKLLPFLHHQAMAAGTAVLDGAGHAAAVAKGEDGMTPEQVAAERERRQRMAEMARQPPRASGTASEQPQQQASASASAAPGAAATGDAEKAATADAAAKPFSFRAKLAELYEQAAASFSTQAGVAAIIDHCTRAKAAAAAIESGVDVKSVNVVAEKSSVTEGRVVVGYIDAPAATDEQVLEFAEVLQKKCPAAKAHGRIEWRRGSPGAPRGGAPLRYPPEH